MQKTSIWWWHDVTFESFLPMLHVLANETKSAFLLLLVHALLNRVRFRNNFLDLEGRNGAPSRDWVHSRSQRTQQTRSRPYGSHCRPRGCKDITDATPTTASDDWYGNGILWPEPRCFLCVFIIVVCALCRKKRVSGAKGWWKLSLDHTKLS